MVAHTFKKTGCTGGGLQCGAGVKAISEDGLHWEYISTEAYPYTMELQQGGEVLKFNRREEPKLLLDAKTGKPLALFNVVDDTFLYNSSRIIVQELDYD